MVDPLKENLEGVTVFDDQTGEALEIKDAGTHISQLGASDDEPVAEFVGVDTGGRRRFAFDEARDRLRVNEKETEYSELELFSF